MRALLYTAGAYVLCAGGTAAFTTNSAARCGLPAVPTPAMGARGASGSSAGGVPLQRMGAEDAVEAITRADALGNSVHTAYAAPGAPKPFAPPVGYSPRPGSATPSSDAAVSDMARAHKLADLRRDQWERQLANTFHHQLRHEERLGTRRAENPGSSDGIECLEQRLVR